jgi:hypothetical protein
VKMWTAWFVSIWPKGRHRSIPKLDVADSSPLSAPDPTARRVNAPGSYCLARNEPQTARKDDRSGFYAASTPLGSSYMSLSGMVKSVECCG